MFIPAHGTDDGLAMMYLAVFRQRKAYCAMAVFWGTLSLLAAAKAQSPPGGPQADAQVSRDAATLFDRMAEQSAIGFDNAVGCYIVRRFDHTSNSEREQKVADMRKALEKANSYRIANERRLGREVDEAVLQAEIEANVSEFSKGLFARELQTYIEKYYIQGESYRLEQMPLPDDVDLDDLLAGIVSAKIAFTPTYVRTWDGKQYAEIVRDVAKRESAKPSSDVNQKARPPEAFATLSYENLGAMPKFTTYGRDSTSDPRFLSNAAEKGYPSNTEHVRTEDGDDAIKLTVNVPESLSLYLEVVVLPAKGYTTRSSYLKVRGAVLSREECREFVQTTAGFWLPTRLVREAYKLDTRQVPYLSSKEELLAVEPPRTNVPLPTGIFDLPSTEEWKALPLSRHLLPQGSPLLEEAPLVRNGGWAPRLFFVINAIIVVALAAYLVHHRRAKGVTPPH